MVAGSVVVFDSCPDLQTAAPDFRSSALPASSRPASADRRICSLTSTPANQISAARWLPEISLPLTHPALNQIAATRTSPTCPADSFARRPVAADQTSLVQTDPSCPADLSCFCPAADAVAVPVHVPAHVGPVVEVVT